MKRILSLSTAALIALLSHGLQADDESNFSTAPDASWARLDPLNRATFDFSGGRATISCTAPTPQEAQVLGVARAALLSPTTFTQTAVTAEIHDWSPDSARTFCSLIARVPSAFGLGQTDGYTLSILNTNGTLEINRIDNEIPTRISSSLPVAFQRGRSYRLVLVCVGSTLTGRIYDSGNLSQVLGEVVAVDATYPSGRCGLVTATDALVPIMTQFDNFLAWDGTPPPLSARMGLSGEIQLIRSLPKGVATNVRTTTDIAFPNWQPTPVLDNQDLFGELRTLVIPDGPIRYYRLYVLGAP